MSFSARIPKYVVFRKNKKDKVSTTSNTNWFSLPKHSEHQLDVQKISSSVIDWNYWGTGTAAVLYLEEEHTYVHFNEPCKLRLTGYYQHGSPWNGRQSIQVSLPTGHVVYMSHDVFMRSIMTSGFKKSTQELPGLYVMAYVNRKLIPVQIKSGLHKAVLEHAKKKAKKSLTVRELTVGHIYTSAAGNSALFLGYVNTETMIIDTPQETSLRARPIDFDSTIPLADFGVRFLPKTLATLWYKTKMESWQGRKYTSEDISEKMENCIHSERLWYFRCKKSHKYIDVVPDYYIDTPDNIVMQIRALNERKLEKIITNHRLCRSNKLTYNSACPPASTRRPADILRHYDAYYAQFYAAECNMTLYGMGIIRSNQFKQFETWETATNKFKSRQEKTT